MSVLEAHLNWEAIWPSTLPIIGSDMAGGTDMCERVINWFVEDVANILLIMHFHLFHCNWNFTVYRPKILEWHKKWPDGPRPIKSLGGPGAGHTELVNCSFFQLTHPLCYGQLAECEIKIWVDQPLQHGVTHSSKYLLPLYLFSKSLIDKNQHCTNKKWQLNSYLAATYLLCRAAMEQPASSYGVLREQLWVARSHMEWLCSEYVSHIEQWWDD